MPQFDTRGDGLRVWYSNDNPSRPIASSTTATCCSNIPRAIVLRDNKVSNGRYGTHFMYASGNTAEGNDYVYNTVGIFSMYSSHLRLVGNRITRSYGAAGMGIGLKEASDLIIENNRIMGNAVGIYIDQSPSDPDQPNFFRGNRFAFNGVGVQFHQQ